LGGGNFRRLEASRAVVAGAEYSHLSVLQLINEDGLNAAGGEVPESVSQGAGIFSFSRAA
jgi:hypothetical protein